MTFMISQAGCENVIAIFYNKSHHVKKQNLKKKFRKFLLAIFHIKTVFKGNSYHLSRPILALNTSRGMFPLPDCEQFYLY